MRLLKKFKTLELPAGFKSIGFYVNTSNFYPASAESITLVRDSSECFYNVSEVLKENLDALGNIILRDDDIEWVTIPDNIPAAVIAEFREEMVFPEGYEVYFISIQPHNSDGINVLYGCICDGKEFWYSPELNKTLLAPTDK